jgi:2-polyprenyl-6-methoxyphenol hydroxylase-like FAD-dependent oxidoreductase
MIDPTLRVIVTGGSVGGLAAGLALHRSGHDVHIYERHPGPMDTRGAGIVVQGELLSLLESEGTAKLATTSCRVRRYLDPDGGDGQVQRMPQDFTSWEAIYVTLRSLFPEDRYHMGAELSDFEAHGAAVSAVVEGHGTVEADLIVCADGAQSAARRRFLPEVQPSYAGYVAWRGTVDEASAPPELVRFFDDAFTFSEARSGGHLLAYFIPGDGVEVAPGRRRLNWVWYVGARPDELPSLLTDATGKRHHSSLPLGAASRATVEELVAKARREVHSQMAALVAATPDPFLQTIVDVDVPRTVFGRACLVGDAAFVVRPHTAGATAKAAFDARMLAACLARPANLEAGLHEFEQAQILYGREVMEFGIALGKRWARTD